MKIIITDAHSRKAFDIINILKRVHDYDVMLFAPTGYHFPLPLIYGQKVYRLSNATYCEFKVDLVSALEDDKGKAQDYVYLPVSEEPTLYLYDFLRENLPFNVNYLLPEKQTFQMVRDKKQFQSFCEKNNLPVPLSFSPVTFSSIKENFRPVIAKKRIGAGSIGMKYVDEPDQLDQLEGIDHEEYLIQERIESNGKIHGGFYLCENGEVKVYHGHERIRTFPEKGGVTVFSKAAFDDELREIGASLLKLLNWDGFAMVEFLYDTSTNEWKIIELNPRLWGSIMLAEFCQSDMLNKYIKLATNEEVEESEIETDRYIRWLFPFEVISLLKGEIRLREFLNTSNKKTCYINFTYSSLMGTMLFHLYFTFNGRSIKRFIKKIFS